MNNFRKPVNWTKWEWDLFLKMKRSRKFALNVREELNKKERVENE